MELNQEYIYRNTLDLELIDENTAMLRSHDSDGVRLINESGKTFRLSFDTKGLRFSLEPNSFSRCGPCWKVSVNYLRSIGFEIFKESGSQVEASS